MASAAALNTPSAKTPIAIAGVLVCCGLAEMLMLKSMWVTCARERVNWIIPQVLKAIEAYSKKLFNITLYITYNLILSAVDLTLCSHLSALPEHLLVCLMLSQLCSCSSGAVSQDLHEFATVSLCSRNHPS
jgi:hypothetical protein